jgi:hypothetical protein
LIADQASATLDFGKSRAFRERPGSPGAGTLSLGTNPPPELPMEPAMRLSPVFFHRCVAFAAGLLLAGIGVVNP